MAKKKGRRRRQGWFSKAVNIAFTVGAFAIPISKLIKGEFGYFTDTDPAGANLIGDATGAMGKDIPRAIAFWSVPAVVTGVGLAFRWIRKKFPVR